MANRRIKDIVATRTTLLADDHIAVDGATSGSAKFLLKPALDAKAGVAFAITQEIVNPVVGLYTVARRVGFAFTVNAAVHLVNQGTATFDGKIDGTNITGLAAVAAGTSETVTNATAANAVGATNRLETNISALTAGCSRLTIVYQCTRT